MYRAPTVRKFLVASPADAVDGTSKEIYGDSKGGSRGVWADGLGDRAGGGGFGIQHSGARSERGVAGQGTKEHRQEPESAGRKGHDHGGGKERNPRAAEGHDQN